MTRRKVFYSSKEITEAKLTAKASSPLFSVLQQGEIKLIVKVKPDSRSRHSSTLTAPAQHRAQSLVLQDPDKVDSEGLTIQFAGELAHMNHALDADWSRFLAKLSPAWSEFQPDGIIVDEPIKCSQFHVNTWAVIA
jgi:hypothetical protein